MSQTLARAEVAELADAHGSGPCTRKGVGVRVPSSAPLPLLPSTCHSMIPALIPFQWRIAGVPNREVTQRVQTKNGLRYCPAVLSANGRIKPDWVLVNDVEERHPEGAYYLEWREGKKRVRRSVGKDAAEANLRRQQKEAALNATNHGVEVVTSDSER